MSAETGSEEPIDAEFEPAQDAPPPPPVIRKRGPGWFSTFTMMLLATAGGGVIGYGAARYAPEWRGTPGFEALSQAQSERTQNLNALSARLDALEDSVDAAQASAVASAEAALETRLSGLREDIDALADMDADTERLDRLARRLSILEAAGERDGASPEEVTRSLSALTGRADALSERFDSLNERIGAGTAAAEDNATGIEAVQADIAALGEQVTALETDMAGLASAPDDSADRLGKAALALAEIEAAARRGQPFPAALSDLSAARPDTGVIGTLSEIAQTGAPTLETLAARYPEMAASVRKAAAPQTDGGAAGLAGRIFGDAIEVRRDDERPLSDSLETAGTALESGDLGGAIAALETLDGPAGEAAAPWLEQARKRRTLERSLDTLRLELMRQEP